MILSPWFLQANDRQEEPQDPHVKNDDHPGGQVEGIQFQ